MSHRGYSRRGFLGTVLSGLLSLPGAGMLRGGDRREDSTGPRLPRSREAPAPRVVIAQNPKVLGPDGAVDTTLLDELLDSAVETLIGTDRLSAWKSLFGPGDSVGIKVNCLAGRGLSTHPELVRVIVGKLTRAGVSEENIIVWDRTDRDLRRAGFEIRRTGTGWRCYGTNGDYDTGELEFAGSVGSLFSPILSRKTTAVINVPVLKDHDLAGVTLGMKNFYGAIHNPNKYHDNNCSPYVADLNSHPFIRDKLRLVITDALVAQYHGGPSFKPPYSWHFSGVIAARDQVAHDAVGWRLIEEKRKEAGLPSLTESERRPAYIEKAAELGLGVADYDGIEVLRT
jgi:uncharacterized protein (DUF362 family)